MLALITLLLFKHFIVDFLLQPRWMYANKGTLGHPGGLAHALLHGATTAVILLLFTRQYIVLATWEALAHYCIDWAKVNINKKMGWGPTTHEQFWWLLGFDQWLHNACYIFIVAMVFMR